MWKVEVTTTTDRQPRARASRATVLASPCVLKGTASKHTTREFAYRCVAQSLSAGGQCLVLCTVDSASTGATPRRMSASAGGSRRLFPESTTTASACAGARDSAGGQTKSTRHARNQAATIAATTSRRRRTTARRYPLAG